MSFLKAQQYSFVGLMLLVTTFSIQAGEIKEYQGNVNKQVHQNQFDEEQFHQVLLAEFYNSSNQPKQTLNHYLPIALKSNDPLLLKRVTEIAIGSEQLKKGLEAAKHWVELSSGSLEAQQYLTLLLLRDNQLQKSAKRLSLIRAIIDKESQTGMKNALVSKGLKFVGALLVIESHHDKAYTVFRHYLDQLKHEPMYHDQKQLILASLGMKAKEYGVVVSALDKIDMVGSKYFASAAVMKTKALKKLGRISDATDLLHKITRAKRISDSLRLELTQLLISVDQKAEAEVELEKLVKKHPDNNGLLKALIALNVTQKQWKKAKKNNYKLSKSDIYLNEANYFYGEIFEGEGDLKSALTFYRNVQKGVFLRKSYSKRAKLLAQINGIKSSQEWLHSKQKKAFKVKDKSYWLKLEADLLSDTKLSFVQNTRQKNIIDAIKLYNKVIALSPKKINYRYYRGLLFERSNQVARAESDFSFVVEKGKYKADALNALGFLLVKHTDRLNEAKAHIKKAYKLKPYDALIMDSLGWVYYRTGEVKKAEGYLRKAFKKLKSPEVASHLITVLSEAKKYQEARMIFNTMIKKYPNNVSLGGVKNGLEHI
jgi:predicted Zn-dependent protease